MSEQSVWTLLSYGPHGWGDELLAGALLTLQLAICSLAIGLLLGLFVAGGRLSSNPALRWLAGLYNLFIRGLPEFLLLLLVFFGLELVLQALVTSLGFEYRVEVPKFIAATIGLSLIFAAYASEVFRGAYLAVPSGQMEAAIATGMSERQAFVRIRLPQMWRFAIPGLGNLWMVLLKDTSLAAVIALDELLRHAKVASESTREPLLFYMAAGVLYLIMTGLSDIVRYRLEQASLRGVRRS